MTFDLENFKARVGAIKKQTGRSEKALSKVFFKNTQTLSKVLDGTSLSGLPTLMAAERRLAELETTLKAETAG